MLIAHSISYFRNLRAARLDLLLWIYVGSRQKKHSHQPCKANGHMERVEELMTLGFIDMNIAAQARFSIIVSVEFVMVGCISYCNIPS